MAGRNVKHGMSRTRTYRAWENMLVSAMRPGGPGCDARWITFTNFYDDMGRTCRDWHLHRVDKSQPYNKQSTVWRHVGTGMMVPKQPTEKSHGSKRKDGPRTAEGSAGSGDQVAGRE